MRACEIPCKFMLCPPTPANRYLHDPAAPCQQKPACANKSGGVRPLRDRSSAHYLTTRGYYGSELPPTPKITHGPALLARVAPARPVADIPPDIKRRCRKGLLEQMPHLTQGPAPCCRRAQSGLHLSARGYHRVLRRRRRTIADLKCYRCAQTASCRSAQAFVCPCTFLIHWPAIQLPAASGRACEKSPDWEISCLNQRHEPIDPRTSHASRVITA